MRFSQCLSALAAAASVVSAAESDVEIEKRGLTSFTIEQVEGAEHLVSAPILLERYYRKYHASVPDKISSAAAKQKASVQTVPLAHQKSYVTPVTIGGEKFHLILDTGSSDLWVFSNQQSAAQKKGHSIYKPGQSKSAKKLSGKTWSVHYGDGSTSRGNVYTDVVKVGGVTSPKQYVEAAKTASSSFVAEKQVDGILGAGFDNLNTIRPRVNKPTFMSRVLPKLQAPVIGAYLSANQKPGAYDIGLINKKHYKGKIHTVPVNSGKGYWGFTAKSYSVGKKTFNKPLKLIADTGTSLMLLPRPVALQYYRNAPKALTDNTGSYYIPCDAKLPPFCIKVGGAKRCTPGHNLNYAPFQTIRGTKYCIGGIQASSGGINILGDTFLQSQYVVFNYKKKTLGFADKR